MNKFQFPSPWQSLLPPRDPWGHKGTFGKVLILGGSVGFTGAPRLAASGALRSGCGLIFVGVPQSVYSIVASGLVEPMVFPLPDFDGCLSIKGLDWISSYLQKCDACLLGIGMGQTEETEALAVSVVQNAKKPVIVDADGINVLTRHIDVLRNADCPLILTPHDGEFARFGASVGSDRVESAARLANDTGTIVALKGHRTVVTDGKQYYVNQSGNAGMAKGGSGDVLAGIILSLLGQGADPFTATALGVSIHGQAGDICAQTMGQYSMTPMDMVQAISQILR